MINFIKIGHFSLLRGLRTKHSIYRSLLRETKLYITDRGGKYGNVGLKRFYSPGNGSVRKLQDGYLLKEWEKEGRNFILCVSRERLKDFKQIVYISFTEESELKRGDYLFSIEDSKTVFDFYSPVDCKVEHVNPKFKGEVSEENLKNLFEYPENEENYLIKLTLADH